MAIPILIDTDCSFGGAGSEIDDAFALACAAADPDVDLLAVTTVHGNDGLDTVTARTSNLLDQLGVTLRPIPGADRPRQRSLRPGVAPARAAEPGRATAAIAELVLSRPGEITLIALGPLTNVADLIDLHPEATAALREIVLMGGAYNTVTGRGDLPGEFNIWVDPDAAATVFTSGVPLRAVGLDVTERVRLSAVTARTLAQAPSALARHYGATALRWIAATASRRPGDPRAQASCAVHDALAVAAVVRPELFAWRPAAVQVEAVGDVARGVTVADFGLTARAPRPTCSVAVDVDETRVLMWVLDRLAAATAGRPHARNQQ